jgi:phosphate transport system substrate-binding protein
MKLGKKTVLLICTLMILAAVWGCTSNDTITGNAASAVKANKGTKEIQIKGSDTMLQLVSNQAEAFSKINQGIRMSVTGGGSGTGIASLINGDTDIADSSRKIKPEELQLASSKGKDIIEIIVARDMLTVIVNKDNALTKITMEDLAGIFKGDITNWKQVGGKDGPITLYGRQSTSGTYAFFMEDVVKGDYSPNMRNMEGNQAIIDAVSTDKSAIGYVGIGYLHDSEGKVYDGLTALKVAKNKDSVYLSSLDISAIKTYPISRALYQYVSKESLKSKTYPISRALYQYVSKESLKSEDISKFLMFELSNDGQSIVSNSGYIRIITDDIAANSVLMK